MKAHILALSAVLLVGTAISHAQPAPASGSQVFTLVETADVIAVGHVTEVSISDGQATARVSVARFLKNTAGFGESSVAVVVDQQSNQGVQVGQLGILFAKKGPAGILIPVSPYTTMLPASPRVVSAVSPDPSVAVADELVRVIATPGSELIAGATYPPDLLLDNTERLYAIAARGLKSLSWDSTKQALKVVLQGDANHLSKVWAGICLLRAGDLTGADIVISAAQAQTGDVGSGTIEELGGALETFDPERDLVATESLVSKVAPLMASPDVNLRRATASFLRNSESKSALKPLAGAISDSDEDVRYFSMTGLAQITGLQPVPDAVLFHAREAEYLVYWTAWRATNHY